jgi:hypothetical protein
MIFNDLVSRVESLLNLKTDYDAAIAKIAVLEASLAQYTPIADIEALAAKIDNALNSTVAEPSAPV